jgi:hypothetical protein
MNKTHTHLFTFILFNFYYEISIYQSHCNYYYYLLLKLKRINHKTTMEYLIKQKNSGILENDFAQMEEFYTKKY